MLLAALVGLGVYFASGHKSDGSSGYARPEDAPLITADAGPYKVSPTDPGGAQITGIDDSVATVASGADRGSALAPDATEEPLPRPGAAGTATEATPAAPPTNLLPPAVAPAATARPPPPPPRRSRSPPRRSSRRRPPVVAPKPVAPAPKPDARVKPRRRRPPSPPTPPRGRRSSILPPLPPTPPRRSLPGPSRKPAAP